MKNVMSKKFDGLKIATILAFENKLIAAEKFGAQGGWSEFVNTARCHLIYVTNISDLAELLQN